MSGGWSGAPSPGRTAACSSAPARPQFAGPRGAGRRASTGLALGEREACQHRASSQAISGSRAPRSLPSRASVGGHGACCVFAGLPAGWGLRPCGKVEPRECGVLRVPAACGHWGDHAPLEEQLCSRPVPVCGGQTGLTAEMVQCDTCPQGEADPASPGRRGAPGI